MSLVKQFWTADAEPENKTLTQLLYEIRKDDEAGQIFDAVEMSDIEAFADEILETPMFDALITPFSKLERKMNVMLSVMKSAAQEVEPTSVTISKPFKKYNSVQVGVVFTLSDEQTITIFFHNPDTTPTKLSPTDDLVSWKWLLNKKDVTIIVAPEHGKDLNVREVARRLMKIAEKNSAAFLRQNANLKARKEQIEKDTKEIEELEKELASVLEEIKFLEEDNAKRKENIKNLTEKVEAEKTAQQEEQEKQAEEEQAKAEEEQAKAEEAAKEEDFESGSKIVDLEKILSVGTEWQKNDLHRQYFNDPDALAEVCGLSVSRYKTGNISYASLHGEKISNSKASDMMSALSGGKCYFDYNTGRFFNSISRREIDLEDIFGITIKKPEETTPPEPEPEPKDQAATPTNTDEEFLRGIIDGSIDVDRSENMDRLEKIAEAHDSESDPLMPLLNDALNALAADTVNKATNVLATAA